jgi:hypothetical protein
MLFRCSSETHLRSLLRKAPAPCAIPQALGLQQLWLSPSRLCQWLRSERSCGNTNEFQTAEAETFRGFVGPWRPKWDFSPARRVKGKRGAEGTYGNEALARANDPNRAQIACSRLDAPNSSSRLSLRKRAGGLPRRF